MKTATNNKSHILSCATFCFAQGGYEACSISEIVERSGITRPTLYHYFGSKLGLYNAILDEYAPAFITVAKETLPHDKDASQTLSNFMMQFNAQVSKYPVFIEMGLCSLCTAKKCAKFSLFSDYLEEFKQPVFDYFHALLDSRGASEETISRYANALFSLLRMTSELIVYDGLADSPELAYRLTHQFLFGIYS